MILITGATGLVGAYILAELLRSGKRIRALRRVGSEMDIVRRATGNVSLENIEWVEADLNNPLDVADLLEGVEEVYHSAALVSFHSSDVREMMRTNVSGTANLVNAALVAGVKKFCYIGSVAALGRPVDDQPINENLIWKPSKKNSAYAISKYGGEREVWRGIEEGLNAVIVNPVIVIGPGNWKTGSSQMFSSVWKGLPFYATGSTGFVDVRDVAQISFRLMQENIFSERFIICSENLPYRDVFDMIADGLGKKRAFIKTSVVLGSLGWRMARVGQWITGRKAMLTRETFESSRQRRKFSSEKVRSRLDYTFIPIKESVNYTCEFFLEEQKRH